MFDPNKITQTEIEFIRVYVRAMKREYHLLHSVLALMHPEQLGMRCIVAATKAAKELQEMQAEFDQSVALLSTQHQMRVRKTADVPTADDLADMFTMSFFKVISPTPYGKKDDGWFSGEPGTLESLFKSLKKLEKDKLPNALATYFAAAFKLFAANNKKYPLADDPLNHWNLPPQTFKFKGYASYKDENYEDDDEEDDDEYDYWGTD
jgi:hypothetical protein